MSEHPTPWTAAFSPITHVLDANGKEVARVSIARKGTDEVRALVRLVAAAPELLEALTHMEWCRACAEDAWEKCEGGRHALAAIAKAKGEA